MRRTKIIGAGVIVIVAEKEDLVVAVAVAGRARKYSGNNTDGNIIAFHRPRRQLRSKTRTTVMRKDLIMTFKVAISKNHNRNRNHNNSNDNNGDINNNEFRDNNHPTIHCYTNS